MKITRFSIGIGLAILAVLAGTTPIIAQQYQDNVVIVLDASGSMAGKMRDTGTSKMDAAKSALKTVLSQIPPSTHVGLLVFSAGNVRDDWVYPLGPRDDAALMQAIDLPQPKGGTPLGRYIKRGADRLLEEREKQFGYGSYRLLVVTDGEAQDQKRVDSYTPEVMARGITVDVIGVGMKQNHTLARKVHSYRAANDPEALQRAVAEVMAEVSRSRTDMAGESAFELIAPIPADVAATALGALSTSGNQPIGERPARRPASVQPPADASQGHPRAPASGGATPRATWGFFAFSGVLCFMFGVGFLVLLVWLIKRASRR